MPLQIFNSLSQQRELFKPIEPGVVKMYVCGPTVYDDPHIGHLRSAYVFDVIRNYLKYSGYRLKFVRNVTDVDDKIIEKARQEGCVDLRQGVQQVAEKYYNKYKTNLKKIGIQDPDIEPKATEYISKMIDLIQELKALGRAYQSEDGIYFDIEQYPHYGELSKQDRDAMRSGVRIDKNENKKSFLDFALWKKSKEDEPSWTSPWGPGRPGWHIECSAMSMGELGDTFDIHGGGRDLIFPHHENELAQSKGKTSKPLANYWIHHGLITVGGQKMSKSLKNFITLDEVLKEDPLYGDEVLKLTFLGTHYSAPLDYTPERVKMDRAVWKRFLEFFENARQAEKRGNAPSEKRTQQIYASFREAMDNDFNTPDVLALMHGQINQVYKENDPMAALSVAAAIRNFGSEVFGIVFDRNDVSSQIKPEIEEWIAKRQLARKNKDFKTADEIRENLLKEKHVELRDLSDGRTTWRVKL